MKQQFNDQSSQSTAPLYYLAGVDRVTQILEKGIEPTIYGAYFRPDDSRTVDSNLGGRPADQIVLFADLIAADAIAQWHVRVQRYALFEIDPDGIAGTISRVLWTDPSAPFLRDVEQQDAIATNFVRFAGIFDAELTCDREWFPKKARASAEVRAIAETAAKRWNAELSFAQTLEEEYGYFCWKETRYRYFEFLKSLYDAEAAKAA